MRDGKELVLKDCEKMRKITLKESQNGQLNILKKVIKICDELGIEYWGMYGTLIGAIRHHGFIPWDDDLDIAMRRPDYERFISFFKRNKVVDGLHIDIPELNKDYPYYICRVCDDRYLLKFDQYKYESGLFIDVYPFDGMGNSEEFWVSKEKELLRKRILLCKSCSRSLLFGSKPITKILNIPIVAYSKVLGRDHFYKRLDREAQIFSWDESKYVGLAVWEDNAVLFKKELFEKMIDLKFEDINIKAPARYDEILKQYYGDYMQLPPLEKRKPQHYYTAYVK